jgi:CIC family chloride channel protein
VFNDFVADRLLTNSKEDQMAQALKARDIMHPRVSLTSKLKGEELVEKMMCEYPALPVVDDNMNVIGIVSESDILSALKEKRTVHEFSAESLMTCGHAEHGACGTPVTCTPDTTIDKILDIFFHNSKALSCLPVVDNKKLVGIISKKNIIYALAEKMLPEAELQKRTPR